ncbi:MAG: PqqD family protein [Lachnospiraceae bacterium]|nr:PqqD family protein [Lachnospiraceae bacterium]
MKLNPCWTLQNIAGTPYILPFGQAVAELRHGILVNGTGVFLWKQLQNIPSYEELLSSFASYYRATKEELPRLKADMDEFLDRLMDFGILQTEEQVNTKIITENALNKKPEFHHSTTQIHPTSNFTFEAGSYPAEEFACIGERYLEIGGLTLRLLGPTAAFAPEFAPFACKAESSRMIDLTIEVIPASSPADKHFGSGFRHTAASSAPYLICHPELTIRDRGNFLQIHFPQAPQIQEMILRKDEAYARCICTPPLEGQVVTDLFHAIRFAYLYLAQKKGIYALHSASILYQGKAWLFSGPSGTGKSTHTEIWNRLFGVPILNGDLNLLTIRNGTPYVCGLPWCGTSGISTTEEYPLGGVILLKQSRHNLCQTPDADRQILLLSQRFISPVWTRNQLESNLRFAEAVSLLVPVRRLNCTKEDEAAIYMKELIDSQHL